MLLATLLLTDSEGSFFRFSRIGKSGAGSFFNAGIAMAHGKRGRLPSLASLRTLALLCEDHLTISSVILLPYCNRKGLTANSQLINCVTITKAFTDVLK